MNEVLNIAIGGIILLLGIPIGKILAKLTVEELDDARIWLKLLVIISLIGGFVGLILRNDVIMFTLFFITIVTLQSIKKTNKNLPKTSKAKESK